MPHDLPPRFQSSIRDATGASSMRVVECIQQLWSGYGEILRVRLDGGGDTPTTVVAKHVRIPDRSRHPRGWNSTQSHERKLRSYQVETAWYRHWSRRCGDGCRVPHLLAYDRHGEDVLLVLEDLDAAGFPLRLNSVTDEQLAACLDWLAHFHATFMGDEPDHLWPTGTYWHLATRGEELAVLDDPPLKQAAATLDQMLSHARHRTLVHGDAKLANFCFSPTGAGVAVAAVDFQYVGGGCGMKDVAYFIGSCLDEEACEAREAELLDRYFATLRTALANRRPDLDADAVEREWRALFPVAWTDFHRFLKGWSPGHWKINSYSERLARDVIASL